MHQGFHGIRLVLLLSVLSVLTYGYADSAPLPSPDEVYPPVPDWSRARVLHIGDSQLSRGYKAGLAARFNGASAVFHQETWVGSRSKSWIISGKARRLVQRYQPNVVVITLGTNLINYDHPERELSWIRALVERAEGTLCYWIGPPPLIPDRHGYNDMMAKNAAPCRYFDSRKMGFPVRKDGRFHLSREQGSVWAEAVWRFMNGR